MPKYMFTKERFDEAQELLFKTWAKAKELDVERQAIVDDLKKYSIFTRLFQRTKLAPLREKIKELESECNNSVLEALGMAKCLRSLRKLAKEAGYQE